MTVLINLQKHLKKSQEFQNPNLCLQKFTDTEYIKTFILMTKMNQ